MANDQQHPKHNDGPAIIIHRYSHGEGFVQVATPHTVPSMMWWLDKNLEGTKAKIITIPESAHEKKPDSALFTDITPDDADLMMSTTDIDDLVVIRTIRHTKKDPFHYRTYREVKKSQRVLGIHHIPHHYRTNSVIGSFLNYFSPAGVNRRIWMVPIAEKYGANINDIDDNVFHLSKLHTFTSLNGVSAFTILVDHCGANDKVRSLTPLVEADDTCVHSNSSLLGKMINIVSEPRHNIMVDHKRTLYILKALNDVGDVINIDQHDLPTVIDKFTHAVDSLTV